MNYLIIRILLPVKIIMLGFTACDTFDSDSSEKDLTLEIFRGDNPHVITGAPVTPDPAVVVTSDGEPVRGETIRFQVQGEHGEVLDNRVMTNQDGRAFFEWFMEPDYNGEHKVEATLEDQSVQFTAIPVKPDPDSSYFGRRQYVEYQPGTSPIILATSHGGHKEPDEISDRTWGVTVRDLNTRELTLKIADELEEQSGERPHVIISHLRRTKLDPNREIQEAAQNNTRAERAWHEYHRWTETAQTLVEEDFDEGFYVDVHGHGHSVQRLELGYLLRSGDLNQSDREIDDSRLASQSSIRHLSQNVEIPFSELLRGEESLGEIMEQHGYPSVPSASDPSPGEDPYFSGGYSTDRYGSNDGGTIDGVQLEANFQGVRDTEENRREFAEAFSTALLQFLEIHTEMDL